MNDLYVRAAWSCARLSWLAHPLDSHEVQTLASALDAAETHEEIVAAVLERLARDYPDVLFTIRRFPLVRPDSWSPADIALRVGERLMGALQIASDPMNRIGEEERRHLQAVAIDLARAFDRFEYMESERRAHAQLARLSAASARLASSVGWEQTLDAVTGVLVPAFADGIVIEGAGGEVVLARGERPSSRATQVRLEAHGRVVGELRLDVVEAESASLLAEVSRRIAVALDAAARERELVEAIRIRDEFLAIAGHELRTPLTSLRMALWSARNLGAASSIPPDLAERQVARLERLIDQLLDVTRISAGRLTLEREQMDLAALTREIAAGVSELERIPIRVRASSDARGAWDPLRISQVVINLLSNAVKYGRGEPIDVLVESMDEGVRLSVRDRGIGIAKEALVRIFERFERAVPGAQYGGLGLGLWIAREIVRAHGGSIQVAAAEDVGTQFVVVLPR